MADGTVVDAFEGSLAQARILAAREIEELDARDVLDQRLSQASAIATMITGEGFETFSRFNDEIRQNYLWALATLIREAELALKKIN